MYVARHSWASLAYSNGVSLSTISHALGHDSEKATLIYLKELDSAAIDIANKTVISLLGKEKKKRRCKDRTTANAPSNITLI